MQVNYEEDVQWAGSSLGQAPPCFIKFAYLIEDEPPESMEGNNKPEEK